MAKLPSFQFYPGDWLRDAVSGCSLAAQGLWLRMMIVMHDSPKYGYLVQNGGEPLTDDQIARRCGCTIEEYRVLFDELRSAGVPRFVGQNTGQIVFSKRMRDDQVDRNRETVRKRIYREKSIVPPLVPPLSRKCPTDSSSSSSSSVKEKHIKKAVCVFVLPEWFPRDKWSEFLAHRKAIKAPVSEESYPGFLSRFDRLRGDGWLPDKVIDIMVEKGWRWFKPEWMNESFIKDDRLQPNTDNPLSRQKAADIIKKWEQEE